MDFRDESSRFGELPATTSRNMSSSSSAAFFSANQSPFFSPRSPKPQQQRSESTLSDAQCESFDPVSSSSVYRDPEPPEDPGFSAIDASCRTNESQRPDCVASTSGFSNSPSRYRRLTRGCDLSLKQASSSVSVSYNRLRCCDVFIGLHGRKPSLLRFAGWLRAELEVQGMSCFVSDRSRCRSARKCGIVEKAMDVSSFGVVILTRKSFKNPYTIEELRFFSSKKNLVPIFFDLSPSDCLVRDIVEKRGNLWEKHGGELWILYGGIEKEWKEAVHGLSRVDEWKLEAYEGNWRDCIFRAVTLLAMRLGRRSIVERLTKWRDKAEKEEFPYPRNENFIGREKELTKLEFILFGDITGDTERDYVELKARGRRKSVTLGWNKSNTSDERRNQSKKGKEKMVCKESEKEIEIQSTDLLSKQQWRVGRGTRRKRSMNIVFGKGVACVYGDSGIGKTELLLEFAYRYHQRYKMVLWIGGESRYIRQNYLNLWQYLEVDVGVENCSDKTRMKSFEEQEDAAISRIRKELMRNIPFLIVIDNLESEKDWWDSKLVMDLLPRFGCQTHILISTSLPRVMNIEPMELSFLSEAEALSLMLGSIKDYPISEIDALKVIEEKLGRLTLGLAIVGAILSELPINPTRLLDTINRMPLREVSWSGREALVLRQNKFLLQLFEVCFSIFDHAEGPRSLATRMVMVSGWFAPAPVPVSILALAAHKLNSGPKRLWRKLMRAASTCAFSSSYAKRSEAEAASMLLRFNIARSSAKQGSIHFHELIKLYTRRRLAMNENANAPAMVQAVMNRGTISEHSEHIWAVCFLLFGFSNEAPVLQLKISELLFLMKQVILPLSIRTFITFSRCSAALELLRVCTNALEAADQTLVAPVEKWLDKSLCWRPVQTHAQINPNLWQELALARATVLETRAKLMLRGGQFGVADDLIRKAIFIRTSISGEDHPGTVSARETLSKLTRLLSNVHQIHNTSP